MQVTYVTLAFLMGGGLVLFGIGGGTSGGLLDAFKGGGGGGNGNSLTEKRIERNEKLVRRNPRNKAALADLVRDNYQLASAQRPSNATGFPKDARDELATAGRWWQRYLRVVDKPDASLAGLATQLYGSDALNKPSLAQQAALIVAEATKDPQAYLQVVQLAAQAGDERTADLAAQKAVELAPKDQRKQVKDAAGQLRKPVPQQQPQGG